MIGVHVPCGEETGDDLLSRFNRIPERDGRTDSIAVSILRVSVLTRDKNYIETTSLSFTVSATFNVQ